MIYMMTETLTPVAYSSIVKCQRHQCEHTERAGCLMCRAEDHEIEIARQRAEDVSAITDTRVDAVDLMSRVASHRVEVGTAKWVR